MVGILQVFKDRKNGHFGVKWRTPNSLKDLIVSLIERQQKREELGHAP